METEQTSKKADYQNDITGLLNEIKSQVAELTSEINIFKEKEKNVIEGKTKAEIEKLKIETANIKKNIGFEWVKLVLLAIGSIVLFILIQKPESIINQATSSETIHRERAKLLLDVIKESDPEKIYSGLQVIQVAYPSTDSVWFNGVLSRYKVLTAQKIVNDLQAKLEQLEKKRDSLHVSTISQSTTKTNIDFESIGAIDSQIQIVQKNLNIAVKDLKDFGSQYRGL